MFLGHAVRLLRRAADGRLSGHYLWDAAFGELYRRASDFERAAHHVERALEHAPTEPERRVFQKCLQRCHARDPVRGR